MGVGRAETVAFLFTDIEGSTELLRSEPDVYGQIVAEHAVLVRAAVADHGGTARDTEGDSFFCTFPTVGAAVSAAYRTQQALARHVFPHGGAVWVRMGIHVGAAAEVEGEMTGLAIHYAARIAASGHGGQILLSSAAQVLVRDELPPGTWTVDLGRYRVKDFPDAEHVHQLAADDLLHDFKPLKAEAERVDNLPLALTSFVGREAQLRELTDLLGASRLVTLVGPGGTGKTRIGLELATRVATSFDDGVWLVELAAVDDVGHVDGAVATALRVREGSSGTVAPSADWVPDRSARERLVEALRNRRLLVVLDNCEHVVGACAALTTELLTSCPRVSVLATSQRQLAVPGERVYRVPPLALPDDASSAQERAEAEAVKLFVDRATRRCPGIAFDDDALRAVAGICRKLDGLAYAIELAAARVAVLSPAQILSFLETQLAFLAGGVEGGRHQTLRAALDWSYGLLSADEQRALRHLSVFPGDFDFDGARAVVEPDDAHAFAVLETLSRLAESCLIETQPHGPVVRYRLLEGTRQYAGEKLREAGERAEAVARHAAHYLQLAEAAEPKLHTGAQAQWLDRVEAELDNITAALDHLCEAGSDGGLRLASALWHFFVVRGFLSEGREHLARALKACSVADDTTWALASARLASLALFDGDSDEAEARAAVALERAAGEPIGRPARITALLTQGLVDLNRTRISEAAANEEEALRLSEAEGDDWTAAYAHNNLGNVAVVNGDLERAASHYGKALALRRGLDDIWGTAWTLYRIGALATFAGRTDDAVRAFVEGRELSSSIRFEQGRILCLLGLADVAQAEGSWPAAADAYADALAGADELEDPTVAAIAVAGLAVVAVSTDDDIAATRHLSDPRLDVDFPFIRAFRLRAAGLLAGFHGDFASAKSLLGESLAIRARLRDLRRVAEGLDDLALVLVDRDVEHAGRLAGAADRIRAQVGAVLAPGRRPRIEDLHERVGAAPGWAERDALTVDAALELALSAV